MIWTRLVRAELRKLTTTNMPWAFLAVLVVISAINAIAVVWGTDFDGTKTFISTAADQQSLIAFASNATLIAGLFGAIAVAREYGHGTVIPTFLSSPRRHQAVLAQLVAVAIGGAVLGLVGATLTTLRWLWRCRRLSSVLWSLPPTWVVSSQPRPSPVRPERCSEPGSARSCATPAGPSQVQC